MNITDGIKTKASRLIYDFNFPIQLPDFYNPEKGIVDTLRVVVQSSDPTNVAEVAKKVREGMNREQFQPKSIEKNNDEDGENEYFFDCAIIDKLQAAAKMGQEELKMDKNNIDLMNFTSKSDSSSVGGNNI